MPCPHFSALMLLLCILFSRFVVSIRNLDLDSEYVNVGLVNGGLPARTLNSASECLEGGEAGLSPTRVERPQLLDRFF